MHLVIGATGATGKLVVRNLLQLKESVKALARTPAPLAEFLGADTDLKLLAVETGSLLDMSPEELQRIVQGCSSVIVCLGHSHPTAPPLNLVTDAVRAITSAVSANKEPVRLILLNTAGTIRSGEPPRPFMERLFVGTLLKPNLPAVYDMQNAADLLASLPADPLLEWSVVRPCWMTDDAETEFETHEDVTASFFVRFKSSRPNISRFITQLATSPDLWGQWKGKMPLIINKI